MKRNFIRFTDDERSLIQEFGQAEDIRQLAIIDELEAVGVTHHAEPFGRTSNDVAFGLSLYADNVVYGGSWNGDNDDARQLFENDAIYFIYSKDFSGKIID